MAGRPSVVTDSKLEIARDMIADAKTTKDICSTVGISRSTLYRHLAASRDSDKDQPAN